MATEEAAGKFTLDKPLHQLTEDDIAQVTREDCRRYLKEKGMRRPSWNKSQAIQQVIMLKALLETAPDSDACSRKKLRIDDSPSSNTAAVESVSRGTSGDAEKSVSAEGARRKDPEKSDSSCGFPGRFAVVNEESARARATGSTNPPLGQMTIFYSGKVNVYDDMPADKAQTILHVAASPLQFPEGQKVDGTKVLQPLPCVSKAVINTQGLQGSVAFNFSNLQTAKIGENYLVAGEENRFLQEEIPSVEGSSSRKASVQRYLEKRKDR